jgi:hypothetical protein
VRTVLGASKPSIEVEIVIPSAELDRMQVVDGFYRAVLGNLRGTLRYESGTLLNPNGEAIGRISDIKVSFKVNEKPKEVTEV